MEYKVYDIYETIEHNGKHYIEVPYSYKDGIVSLNGKRYKRTTNKHGCDGCCFDCGTECCVPSELEFVLCSDFIWEEVK